MSNVVDLKCSGNAVYFFLHHALSGELLFLRSKSCYLNISFWLSFSVLRSFWLFKNGVPRHDSWKDLQSFPTGHFSCWWSNVKCFGFEEQQRSMSRLGESQVLRRKFSISCQILFFLFIFKWVSIDLISFGPLKWGTILESYRISSK